MIAGSVGVLVVILTVLTLNSSVPKMIKVLCVVAFIGIVIQALLGGLTVLMRLPPPVSISHALLAQIVFSLIVSIAVMLQLYSPDLTVRPRVDVTSNDKKELLTTYRFGFTAFLLILIQTTLGAIVRHTGLGLNAHIGGAVVASLGVFLLIRRVLIFHRVAFFLKPAVILLAFLLVQLLLGYSAWRPWFSHVVVRSAHVVGASLVLAMTILLSLRCYAISRPFIVQSPTDRDQDLTLSTDSYKGVMG